MPGFRYLIRGLVGLRDRLKFEEKRYNAATHTRVGHSHAHERRFDTFQSCSLESRAASGESLSIWTFELVVLVMLAASASLVYYRKLRGGPNGGGK